MATEGCVDPNILWEKQQHRREAEKVSSQVEILAANCHCNCGAVDEPQHHGMELVEFWCLMTPELAHVLCTKQTAGTEGQRHPPDLLLISNQQIL